MSGWQSQDSTPVAGVLEQAPSNPIILLHPLTPSQHEVPMVAWVSGPAGLCPQPTSATTPPDGEVSAEVLGPRCQGDTGQLPLGGVNS